VSTRDLRVRFIGDASNLKGSFNEVNASAAAAAAGLGRADANVTGVGKSFTKTGKLFKATGKVFRSSGLDALSAGSAFASSVPALAGVSSGLGAATIAAEGLSSVLRGLGGFALPALGAAAIAAAVSYAVLHDDVSSATDALRQMEAENDRVKDSHRQVAVAAVVQRNAVIALEGAQLAQRSSAISLEEANRDLAEVAKANGKASLEYRSALLQVQQAEQAVKASRRETISQAQEVIRATERRARVTEEETAAVRRQAAEARKVELGLRLGLIAGRDREAASKKVKAAIEAESQALNRSQARHKANAAAARDAAAAMKGDASPAAQQLRQKLLELANTEADLSQVIAAMNSLASAAGFAASQVVAVTAAIASMPSTVQAPRVVGGRGGGGGSAAGRVRGLFNQNARTRGLNFGLARVAPGSPTSLARIRGAGDRSERLAGLNAEDAARKSGKSDEQIRIAGERAMVTARRKNLTRLAAAIRTRRKKLVTEVKKFDVAARMKVKVPGPKFPEKRAAALQRRQEMKAREQDIRNELESLAADYADLQVQMQELGAELADLDRQDEAEAASLAEAASGGGAEPPSAMDFAEAQAAEAALTPGLDDDLAAARGIEAQANADLAAARASGDPRRIRDAAAAALAARTNREQIEATINNTDALNANTEAMRGFGGSSVFGYRGQDYVLRSLAPPSSDRLVEAAI
jgi:hypothetical protein